MCGIVTIIGREGDRVNEEVIDRFEAQKTRGTKGFGTVKFGKSRKAVAKRFSNEVGAMMELYGKKAEAVMFHHRYPTSTPNMASQAHPILVSNDRLTTDWLVTHNGVISNCEGMRELHDEEGFLYSTLLPDGDFNDSEALAVELAWTVEGGFEDDGLRTRGMAAFVALRTNKKTGKVEEVLFGRGLSASLKFAMTDSRIVICSEGDEPSVEPNTLHSLKREGDWWSLTKSKLEIPGYEYKSSTPEKSDYKDSKIGFSPKESEDKYDREEEWKYRWKDGLETYTENDLSAEALERIEDQAAEAIQLIEMSGRSSSLALDFDEIMEEFRSESEKALKYLWEETVEKPAIAAASSPAKAELTAVNQECDAWAH